MNEQYAHPQNAESISAGDLILRGELSQFGSVVDEFEKKVRDKRVEYLVVQIPTDTKVLLKSEGTHNAETQAEYDWSVVDVGDEVSVR